MALLALVVPLLARGQDPAGLQLFEQKIRPALVEHCYSCHSADAKKVRGGLLVDSRAALLKGGDTGPALVPGKPKESLLLQALRNDGIAMPPKGRLSDEVIADFDRWIRLGATDPRDGKAVVQATIDLEKGRQFWSFRKPTKQTVPTVKDQAWARTDVDRFLLAALEAKGLRPGKDAERSVLVRRLYIDLIGLPPTPEEMERARNDKQEKWDERLVDELLKSPHFGERWGRHWLDVARYADSNG
jgi:hypothetical protein